MSGTDLRTSGSSGVRVGAVKPWITALTVPVVTAAVFVTRSSKLAKRGERGSDVLGVRDGVGPAEGGGGTVGVIGVAGGHGASGHGPFQMILCVDHRGGGLVERGHRGTARCSCVSTVVREPTSHGTI